MSEPIAITELIHRWRNGDAAAQESLINAVYPVMRATTPNEACRDS